MAPEPPMMMDPGSCSDRIISSKERTLADLLVPGSIFAVAPTSMMQLSKVTVSAVPSSLATRRVPASTKVPQYPSYSVILFFFMRKCTPLTMRSLTWRLRAKALP